MLEGLHASGHRLSMLGCHVDGAGRIFSDENHRQAGNNARLRLHCLDVGLDALQQPCGELLSIDVRRACESVHRVTPPLGSSSNQQAASEKRNAARFDRPARHLMRPASAHYCP
ncbi:hypothetical protein D3C86_1884350 [compost metagenome]